MAEPLTHNLVHFTRYLRAHGLRAVPETTVAMIDAAAAVGLKDREDAYHAFKAVTISRPEEIPVFDAAFDLFSEAAEADSRPSSQSSSRSIRGGPRCTSLPRHPLTRTWKDRIHQT